MSELKLYGLDPPRKLPPGHYDRRGQSRFMSWVETLTSTAIGYGVAVTTQVVVFPWFGLNVPLHDNLMIGAVFTAVSLVRGYLVRRAFNAIRG